MFEAIVSYICGSYIHLRTLSFYASACAVGFKEHWIKLLLSKICLEGSHFESIFSKLYPVSSNANCGDYFADPQAFLLSILSEILNERIEDIAVDSKFPLHVLEILRTAAKAIDSVPRRESGLPTGHATIDVLGYSLIILRDICACDHGFKKVQENSVDAMEILVSSGLIELILSLLKALEPPSTIKKGMKQSKTRDEGSCCSNSSKQCPYKGFRRDIVGILGNCAYRRKSVQDKIREENGILLLLQQCVSDEDNPYLREWGIWSIRNLLEGNAENQRLVSDLEMQETVDVPELTGLGLKVEIDPQTRRAKLVNM